MRESEFFTPMAFDFLWDALGIGESPYPLNLRSHGETDEQRMILRRNTFAEFADRGFLDRSGNWDPRLRQWITVLSRPVVSIDALYLPDYQALPVGLLAASDGTTAVIATQDPRGVWLREILPDGLVSTVVDSLPPGKRAVDVSITLPLEEAARTPSSNTVPSGPSSDSASRAASSASEEATAKSWFSRKERPAAKPRISLSEQAVSPRQAYAALLTQPRLRGGQLAVNSRTDLGGRRRSPVLAWFDTASGGRYLSLSSRGSDGREWLTVSPADAKALRTRLGEMVSTITAHH